MAKPNPQPTEQDLQDDLMAREMMSSLTAIAMSLADFMDGNLVLIQSNVGTSGACRWYFRPNGERAQHGWPADPAAAPPAE